MSELIIPQINNNDTHAVLVEWSFEDGAQVEEGDVVAVLETSKSTFDLTAEESGLLKIEKSAGEEYPFGERLGVIGDEQTAEMKPPPIPVSSTDVAVPQDLIISDAARRLIASKEISNIQLSGLGKRIIREKDIRQLLGEDESAEAVKESRQELTQQGGIARVVTRSHREIPAAFLVKRVYCDQALAFLKSRGADSGKMLSLSDLFVLELGKLCSSFPLFFSNVDPGGELKEGLKANVGVTFDFGKGLFVPVISDLDALSLEEVAKRMMRFRMKAMRGKFAESDMSGGSISVSLNMEEDTEFVRPLILPPQTCMVSLGGVLSECFLTEDGAVKERRFMRVGVAYDHRFINGFESQAFANALKMRIESAGADGKQESN